MSNKITITFQSCDQPPANGYNIIYRPLGSILSFRDAGNFFISPAIVLDNNDADGTQYEGYISEDNGISRCRSIYFSTISISSPIEPIPFTKILDSSFSATIPFSEHNKNYPKNAILLEPINLSEADIYKEIRVDKTIYIESNVNLLNHKLIIY